MPMVMSLALDIAKAMSIHVIHLLSAEVTGIDMTEGGAYAKGHVLQASILSPKLYCTFGYMP